MVEFRAYDSKGWGESSFFRLYIPPPFVLLRWHRFSLSSTRAKISSLIIMVIIMVIVGFSLHVVEFRVYDSKRRIVLLPSLYPSSILSSFDGNRFFFIFYSSKDFFLFFNNNGNSWLFPARGRISRVRFEGARKSTLVFWLAVTVKHRFEIVLPTPPLLSRHREKETGIGKR